jgi:glycosyltransferase involved in cell wall biosynthesis
MESCQPKKKLVLATDVSFWNCSAGNEQRITQVVELFKQYCDVIVLYIGYLSKKDKRKISSYQLKEIYCVFEWKTILKDCAKSVINTYFPFLRGILKKMRKSGSLKTRKSVIAKKKLDLILKRIYVDVLCVEYVWMVYLFENIPNSILKIVDTHDVQFDRCESFKKMGLSYDFNISESEEIECLNLADVVLAINRRDFEMLSRKLKTAVVEYPYIPSKIKFEKHVVADSAQNGYRVAFVGSAIDFNINALKWFCERVWPHVKKLEPLSEFHVYGKVAAYAPSMLGVFAHGFVSDEKDIYNQNDIFVNPILMGGGLKIKCVEALMYAKPLVTTAVGAQGIESGIDKAFFVADDENDFARKLILLLHNPEKRRKMSSCSEQVIRSLEESLKKAENYLFDKIGI